MKEYLIKVLKEMWQDAFFYKHYKPINWLSEGNAVYQDIKQTEKTLKEDYKVTEKELDEIFETQKQIFLEGIKGGKNER